MGENLDKLREQYSADYVFCNAGETVEKSGDIKADNEAIKKTVVVLKQSLETAEIQDIENIAFYTENKKITFIFNDNDIYGILTKNSVKGIVIKGSKSQEKSAKGKVKIKERKKITVKGGFVKENDDIKKAQKIEEKPSAEKAAKNYKLNEDIIDTVKSIAKEYLEDFTDDIVNNMVREAKMDVKNLTNKAVELFIKKLSKSSSLIIGPSHAKEMVEKINMKITE
ncbi:hypothetical protein KAU15_03730 [candidate division WOR-3 bacterium]|nr:hypothetical protein [candidate division WOR-3 bacterium]